MIFSRHSNRNGHCRTEGGGRRSFAPPPFEFLCRPLEMELMREDVNSEGKRFRKDVDNKRCSLEKSQKLYLCTYMQEK